ncbi:MAG: phosphoadenosine phosphosulfate reductase [Betaproteobacteria bacterium RIFCSPLOWO2_12_FULL_68_20]|nr:MAG: phosphoadenosine phosphosulfate reductase [Betaproteobacteria bacterium RIFCSPLOWO2_12_FULL_68_20]
MSRELGLEALLAGVAADFAPAALASSLSAEDMVLTDVIARARLPVEVFTLDTGRLHAETLRLIDVIGRRYGIEVRVFRPDPAAVAGYVAAHGRDGFHDSPELRKRCCAIRKLEPLRRALSGKRAWITGQRREQSPTRAALAVREFDAVHGLVKFNPLADWSEAQVWDYLASREVPYNPLYDQGYRSIGCAPCTRAVLPGEDVRAGRWWWEAPQARECGLHVASAGRPAKAA